MGFFKHSFYGSHWRCQGHAQGSKPPEALMVALKSSKFHWLMQLYAYKKWPGYTWILWVYKYKNTLPCLSTASHGSAPAVWDIAAHCRVTGRETPGESINFFRTKKKQINSWFNLYKFLLPMWKETHHSLIVWNPWPGLPLGISLFASCKSHELLVYITLLVACYRTHLSCMYWFYCI